MNSNLSVTIVERNRQWFVAGFRRLHRQQPATILICLHLRAFVAPRSGGNDRLTWLCPAPQTNVRLLLNHHVVADQVGQLHFCLRTNGYCRHQRQRKHLFIHSPKVFTRLMPQRYDFFITFANNKPNNYEKSTVFPYDVRIDNGICPKGYRDEPMARRPAYK